MAVQPALFNLDGDPPKPSERERPSGNARPTRRSPAALAAPGQPVERLLFRPEEAAAILGLGRTKFYELLACGAVASVHIGSSRRVAMTALEDYVARLHEGSGALVRQDGPQREQAVVSLRPVGEPQPTTAKEQQ
jgi:excisionase family DNA binding protein